MIKKFFIMGSGDWSVGIPPSFFQVTFECDYEKFWDEETIKRTKDFLREWDDNGTRVLTEEEFIKYEEAELKW